MVIAAVSRGNHYRPQMALLLRDRDAAIARAFCSLRTRLL